MANDSNNKSAHQEKLEAQLKEIDARIDEWQAKLQGASADARIEAQHQLDKLRGQRDDINQKLEELRNAGENAWDDVRNGVETAINDLRQAVDSAMDSFRNRS